MKLRQIVDKAAGRAAWVAVDEIQAIVGGYAGGTLIYLRGMGEPFVVEHLGVEDVAAQLGVGESDAVRHLRNDFYARRRAKERAEKEVKP